MAIKLTPDLEERLLVIAAAMKTDPGAMLDEIVRLRIDLLERQIFIARRRHVPLTDDLAEIDTYVETVKLLAARARKTLALARAKRKVVLLERASGGGSAKTRTLALARAKRKVFLLERASGGGSAKTQKPRAKKRIGGADSNRIIRFPSEPDPLVILNA